MKSNYDKIKIGSRVRLLSDIEWNNITWKADHQLTVYSSSYYGWDLIDEILRGLILLKLLMIYLVLLLISFII